MNDKKMYMVVNSGEMENYSLFEWTNEELQSVVTLFVRINEQNIRYAPTLYIYECREEYIIPLEEVEKQSWFEDGGYSVDELDIFKLDEQAYTWKDRWRSIYDFPRIF